MKKIIIALIFLISLFAVNSVYAGLVPCGGDGQSECTLCDLWQLASNIINFISFDLAIPVAILMIVVAGVIYMTSGGADQKVALAKTIFTNVIIGLVIIFASWLLIDTLIKTIATTSTESGGIIWSWNEFPTNCIVGPEDALY